MPNQHFIKFTVGIYNGIHVQGELPSNDCIIFNNNFSASEFYRSIVFIEFEQIGTGPYNYTFIGINSDVILGLAR